MSHLVKIAKSFQQSQVLMTATKLGLYDYRAAGPKSVADIKSDLGLAERMIYDFLDI